MKAKTASPETAVLTAERKLHNTWVYIKRHWQLYLLFLLPAVALTLVFKYAPMGGVLIAFQKYNPFKGIWGSEWVGFKNFTRFMSSPDFQRYLINTLKLSVYGLLWGFPIPILLAFLLNRIESKKIKQKVQLVLYMPNFISVIVLCGIVRVLLSVTGPVNGLLHTSINFMTLPEAFRKPGAPLGQKDPFPLLLLKRYSAGKKCLSFIRILSGKTRGYGRIGIKPFAAILCVRMPLIQPQILMPQPVFIQRSRQSDIPLCSVT